MRTALKCGRFYCIFCIFGWKRKKKRWLQMLNSENLVVYKNFKWRLLDEHNYMGNHEVDMKSWSSFNLVLLFSWKYLFSCWCSSLLVFLLFGLEHRTLSMDFFGRYYDLVSSTITQYQWISVDVIITI